MAQPKTSVRPVRLYLPSPELHTTIIRGVGFRAVCDCSHRGPTRDTYMEARKDLRAHKLYHQQGEPLSLAGPL